MADAATPEDQEEGADEDEGKTEADPESHRAPVAAEAEIGAEGETQEPVGGEVAEHGSAGVSRAAECTGGNGLEAVEELESGADGKKGDGGMDDGFIGGVEAGNVTREEEEHDAHGGHEGGAEEDGGVASVTRGDGITAAKGLADTDGSGGSEAERNHVGEGDGVESDLMAGLGDGPKTRDERRDKSENGDFGGELERGGKAESDEQADAGEVGLDGSFEELGFVACVVPEQIND